MAWTDRDEERGDSAQDRCTPPFWTPGREEEETDTIITPHTTKHALTACPVQTGGGERVIDYIGMGCRSRHHSVVEWGGVLGGDQGCVIQLALLCQ